MSWYVAVVLLLLLALVFNFGLLAYAIYALLGVLLIGRVMSRQSIDQVVVTREYNREEAAIGDVIAVIVTIQNSGKWPVLWLLAEDLLPQRALIFNPPSLSVSGHRTQLFSLWPKQQKRILYQLKCNRRGYYQIGPLILEGGDPFGLHRRVRIASAPNFVLVYPKVIPIEECDIASRRPIGEIRLVHRLFEDPTRIAGVRRYEPGDPLRRVHWSATARTGVLHSKVYEPSAVTGATFVLDFHRDGYPSEDEPFRSELAVTAAASLSHAIFESGQQVGLLSNGRDAADRIRTEGFMVKVRSREAAKKSASMAEASDRLRPVSVPTKKGADQFLQIRSTLARLELTDGLSLRDLLTDTSYYLPADASVIVIISNTSDRDIIALGSLVRMGYWVTALVNVFDVYEYSRIAGKLSLEGVACRQLVDESSIVQIGRQMVYRGS